jgi:hypothetical protein
MQIQRRRIPIPEMRRWVFHLFFRSNRSDGMKTSRLVSPRVLTTLQRQEFIRSAIGMSTKEYIKTFKLRPTSAETLTEAQISTLSQVNAIETPKA